MKHLFKSIFFTLIIINWASALNADNGFFQIGYGSEARSLGGAGAATTRDAIGGAINPASTAWVGDHLDLGLLVSTGVTDLERKAGLNGLLDANLRSERATDALAEFGFSKKISEDSTLGIIGYSNGTSTVYPGTSNICPVPPPAAPGELKLGNVDCGDGQLASNYKQFTLAPTYSIKFLETFSLGISVLAIGTSFETTGEQGLASVSSDKRNLSNRGFDYSFGVGTRIGGLWKVSKYLSLGAAWSPKTRMTNFDRYRGLISDRGRLDTPENYSIGFEISPFEFISFVGDFQKLKYGEVNALANPGYSPITQIQFGNPGGPGRGWQNMDVFKVGIRLVPIENLRVSFGASWNTAAFEPSNTSINLASPATGRRHFTGGIGYSFSEGSEFSIYFSEQVKEKIEGLSGLATNIATQINGTPTLTGYESIATQQQSLGFQYSTKITYADSTNASESSSD
ncbi:OmpP1/FadL family transporter [Leptospira sp. GIMC2001]|uniref:OmpP1/FadL family transporter n=1 Tax=Leptospira sp. GIMC2001 TaxID=1513297 RepID=UPI00234BEC2C|nr:hypothetical protein [Leptospira sp. GIMC2001]WCL49634.1 hypothetical protein O4O04_02110 [Leptospira sp. GIMC2001]